MTQTSSRVTPFNADGPDGAVPLRTQHRLAELLAQVTDGQVEALGRLYDLTVPLVFQLSASIRERDLVAAELATQRVFAELWQQAKSDDPSRQSPLTFVMSMARTVAERSKIAVDGGGASELAADVDGIVCPP